MSISAAAFLTGCATEPPPLPPNNPADPQVRGSSQALRNLLLKDETTLAIEKQLSATEAYAESAEKMEHDMGNMPGTQHAQKQSYEMQRQNIESEKKALTEEMKKKPEQMKETPQALKEKTERKKLGVTTYTCPMHLQVRSDKPGNCSICGMELVPKKEESHEGH
jgi:multidrug efflux pump subunit AcrA (membrane-fusion protein)